MPKWEGETIDVWLEELGREDLVAWMSENWIARDQPNSELWAHEFSKHATCFSTFDLPCYGPKYVEHEEIVDYFDTAIKYFLREPTYEWLEKAEIVPSNETAHSLKDFEETLAEAYGAVPYVGCSGPRYNETEEGKGSADSGRTELGEVWYFSWVSFRASEVADVMLMVLSDEWTSSGPDRRLHREGQLDLEVQLRHQRGCSVVLRACGGERASLSLLY